MGKIGKYGVKSVIDTSDLFSGVSKNGAMQHYSSSAMIDFIANEVVAKTNINAGRVLIKTEIPYLNLESNSSQQQVNEAIIAKLQSLDAAINS